MGDTESKSKRWMLSLDDLDDDVVAAAAAAAVVVVVVERQE